MSRAVITYHYIEQGSQEWLDAREGKYTGSNADKLLSNIDDREYAKAKQTGFGGNFWTKRGHLLEDQAIELYEEIKGVKVIRNEDGMKVGFVTNSLFPLGLYSPDGLLEDRNLEVKSFSVSEHLKLIAAPSVKVLAQVHLGMVITGKRLTDLIAYNPMFAKKKIENGQGEMIDNPHYDPKLALVIITIRYDPAIANNLKRRLEARNVKVGQA
jgi:hypothetical protein